MPESATVATGEVSRFVTFLVDGRLYALDAEMVVEIVRLPALARVPQAPAGLLGLANLRGRIVPVASIRALTGGDRDRRDPDRRDPDGYAIVIDAKAPVALAVDAAPQLAGVSAHDIENAEKALLLAHQGELLAGAFAVGDGASAHILDIHALLRRAFVARARESARSPGLAPTKSGAEGRNEAVEQQRLVSFLVAGQEFALQLGDVREIILGPEHMAAMPHSDDPVLGVAAYRSTLLPLLSLRALLGLSCAEAGALPRSKVVVCEIAGALVGLVADQTRAIVTVEDGAADPPPPVLASRAGGETQIKAIYRGEGGRRLISILDPDQLFRGDVMQRLTQHMAGSPARIEADQSAVDDAEHFLAFRLGDDEFALPIACVIEVAAPPAQITRLPKAPDFLEGVISLRGEMLPVVDQRRRFDMAASSDAASRRLIIVRSARHRAALIVDAVSEVLKAARSAIEPAPDLTGQHTRLVSGVINLADERRMVMVLDPEELLSRAERSLLDAFAAGEADAP